MDCQGKSGAKFYRSYDKLFIIKSLTSEEVERQVLRINNMKFSQAGQSLMMTTRKRKKHDEHK
jgi:hypothetical protein